jgi:tetratricopeptide (TPR) repeat protein
MKSQSPPRRFAFVPIGFLTCVFAASVARADDGPADVAEATRKDADNEARALFARGQIHYSLGEYEQAIGQFRRAYELTSAPGLLFNIAQAHRLNGDCKQALEVYRHFIRLAPGSEYRGEADAQVATLTARCGAQPALPTSTVQVEEQTAKHVADAAALVAPPQADLATKPTPRWSASRKTAAGVCAAGVVVGLAAGGVYWWNDRRYNDWRAEDQRLAAAMPSPAAQDSWLADQRRNDSLLRSIQRVDTGDAVLAGLSVAALLTSAVLAIAFDR